MRLSCDIELVVVAFNAMEPKAGIEPATNGLQNRCSTAELLRRKAKTEELVEGRNYLDMDSRLRGNDSSARIIDYCDDFVNA